MFSVTLDLGPLLNLGQEIDDMSKKVMKDAGQKLTNMTYAHIVEEANKRLHSRRQMYVEGLSHAQVDDNTFVINLDAKVRWIDDGMPPHNMVDDLLSGKKAKTAKDGSKYAVIPFKHNKGPTQSTPAQKNLLDTIKKEMKERKISYGGIEKGEDGKPKTGLIHKFDIKDKPIKQNSSPGQGKGPIGKPMQGPTGIPLLQGVRVYQREVTGKDGKKSIKKEIMTFRVVSSKHKGQGRWDHPGTEAVGIMDEAYEWAKKAWEKDIVPQLSEAMNKNF